jgi:hypothetical protein
MILESTENRASGVKPVVTPNEIEGYSISDPNAAKDVVSKNTNVEKRLACVESMKPVVSESVILGTSAAWIVSVNPVVLERLNELLYTFDGATYVAFVASNGTDAIGEPPNIMKHPEH